MSYLKDLLGTLIERPLGRTRGMSPEKLVELCSDLLAARTEAENLLLAADILEGYGELDDNNKLEFFRAINASLDLDPAETAAAAKAYGDDPSPANYRHLSVAAEPARYELLRRLNQPPGATADLVRMRCDLLRFIKDEPELAKTNEDFALMLRSWFNRGFLVLDQITWDSPASILEKIIAYEAVHEIETWDELRRRLHPGDRRCFAFFHPVMPDEPLIFVEVALSQGIPGSIQEVLADQRDILEATAADTAVFYSISNCQKGLAGISFGNSLIKQVVRDIAVDLPGLKYFVTLSPLPGFTRWLAENVIDTDGLSGTDVKRLAAHYLVASKKDLNTPLDPVARFHLSNGAQIKAVHAGADLSPSGVTQSLGVMVNYSYDATRIAENIRHLAETGRIAVSGSVKTLARQGESLVTRLSGSN